MFGPQCSLSTLRGVDHSTAARKTRFRLPARLYRVGLATHRIASKGFRDAQAIASSFPKLRLAQEMTGFSRRAAGKVLRPVTGIDRN